MDLVGKTPRQIRRQIKGYYRPKLLDKTTDTKLALQQRYQVLRRVIDNLAPADKGNFTEAWYQKVYGKPEHLTHFEVTTADAAAQGITLQAQEKRVPDRVEGDTIVEVKTISGSLSSGGEKGRSEIKQFDDNIALAKQGYTKTTSDGVKRQLRKVRYVFTLPKGVKANAKFMIEKLLDIETRNFVSFEIFNHQGERKIIKAKNIKELREPDLSDWLLKK